MNVRTELLFPMKYRVELRDALDADGMQRFYYPGASLDGGRDGLIVEVQPANARHWLGVFAFGEASDALLSGIFSTPCDDVVCVVSSGKGYLVHADKPEWWSEVPVWPITSVRQLTESGLLIFVDFTSLTAWGANGLAWRSG